MHGKVWMFSNLIDDEDIEFMQHEFISYKQAMPISNEKSYFRAKKHLLIE